eukprot:comp12214_c0_seq1/m.6985 comp12214_c0_seq1/g.6985  ORF comp12214_c0_seq1/g.6985 comp12214_c0_seq1/m.6985 type:complete len:293 (-) comp12214_c0_seq1:67-945(-)
MTVEKYEVAKDGNTVHYARLKHSDNNYTEVNLYGATVTSYHWNHHEWIFVSKDAVLDNKKAIRGGIPLVFPNFGPWNLGPQHGFARISTWKVLEKTETQVEVPKDAVTVSFELTDSETTRKMWNYAFRLVMSLILTKDSLTQELTATNTGTEEFDFTGLLHTYFKCDDVEKVTVEGLKGCKYDDKVKGGSHTEDRTDVSVKEFTDRVYHATPDTHSIKGLAGPTGPTLKLTKSGFPETVVWNPWDENAKKMADFGDDEYPNMLCVEAGAVGERVKLAAGKTWSGHQTISVIV